MNKVYKKYHFYLTILLSILVQAGSIFAQVNNTTKFEGKYFGQTPPGLTAKLFCGGELVENKNGEKRSFNIAFSPDGYEMFFSYYYGPEDSAHHVYEIKTFKYINSKWIGPKTASFSGDHWDVDINFSPDGKYVFFASDRPQPDAGEGDIYYSVKTKEGWSDPIFTGPHVSSAYGEVYPSVSKRKNIFFRSTRPGGYGNDDIYRAEWVHGYFINVKNLGPNINSTYGESNAVIAPDESYILFCTSRPENNNKQQIYISFQVGENIWTKAQLVGPEVNTDAGSGSPTLTADGKYLFFKKGIEPDRGIYWISTEIIDNLKKIFQQN